MDDDSFLAALVAYLVQAVIGLIVIGCIVGAFFAVFLALT